VIGYTQALEILGKAATREQFPLECLDLSQALGRICGERVISPEASPRFDNSAMDGFALKWAPALGDKLRVLGTIAAGDPVHGLRAAELQECYAIMTGAELPPGCDTVLRVEDAERSGDWMVPRTGIRVRTGDHVRKQGEDVQVDQLLLEPGVRINPEHQMLLASLGIRSIQVRRQPRIAICATGKELVPWQTAQLNGTQVRASSVLYCETLLQQHGCLPMQVASPGDDAKQFAHFLEGLRKDHSARAVDLLITTGAVSMGEFDFIPVVLKELGATVHFHRVAIKPGKPILFAELGREKGRPLWIFGLPGNPVSTAVGLRFFVLPFLRQMMGEQAEARLSARLVAEFQKPNEMCYFLRGKTQSREGALSTEILTRQGSFVLSTLAEANSWVVLQAGQEHWSAGAEVSILPKALGEGV